MGKDHTFYLIYSPKICDYVMNVNPFAPYYMDYGYLISGCRIEPEKVVFQGSHEECEKAVSGLCNFTTN